MGRGRIVRIASSLAGNGKSVDDTIRRDSTPGSWQPNAALPFSPTAWHGDNPPPALSSSAG